jgi:hypothetical protein
MVAAVNLQKLCCYAVTQIDFVKWILTESELNLKYFMFGYIYVKVN